MANEQKATVLDVFKVSVESANWRNPLIVEWHDKGDNNVKVTFPCGLTENNGGMTLLEAIEWALRQNGGIPKR